MSRSGVLLAVILTLASSQVSAEIVEVPLPALHGAYWQPGPEKVAERYANVVLPAPPSVIYGAWFTVSGSAVVGEYVCFAGEEGERSWPWVSGMYASMHGQSGEWWFAVSPMPEQPGAFGWTAEFEVLGSGIPSWDFLLDGEGRVRLWGAPSGMPLMCSATTPPPSAQVTEAILYVDGEFPVQVESSTWGKLKSLYR
jgi:hypothetical protein